MKIEAVASVLVWLFLLVGGENMVYDVLIIGAGVSGAFIARELSRYELEVCLVEKKSDVAMGTSKANSSIVHAGYDAKPGSLKAMLNVWGSRIMEKTARELDVPYKRIGSLVLAFREEDRKVLDDLMKRGIKNGVRDLAILSRQQVKQMEPAVSDDVAAALLASSAAIICPYELAAGAVENAAENGVELKLEHEVLGIHFENDRFYVATSSGDEIEARFVVNAAGIYADRISSMIGDNSFAIAPRKGEYLLLDKSQGKLINKIIFQLPTDKGKGVLVAPTVDGNLLLGPNAEDVDDREDVSTTCRGIEQVIESARKLVPGFNLREVITSFSGLRARPSVGDFVIGASSVNNKFINVAGIESPGLSCAPAVGMYVADILKAQGLRMIAKDDFNPCRRPVIRFRELSEHEMTEIIRKDPLYGRIICRCEKVTEGEIVDCIRRPAGARNLDAVKRRTRAGMGRCQGGFCSPRVVEILSRELGIPPEKVTKMGGKSNMLMGIVK